MEKAKKIFSFLTIIFILAIIINTSSIVFEERKLQKMEEESSNYLLSERTNLNVAQSYFKIFNISSEENYKIIKQDIYSNFNGKLQKQLFPSDKKEVSNDGIIRFELESVKVAQIGFGEFLYKFEHIFYYPRKNQKVITLITIKNNKIIKIEKL